MNDCEKQDDQPRFRIEVSDTGNYNWKVQNLDYGVVREICLRIAMYLRFQSIYGYSVIPKLVEIEGKGYRAMEVDYFPGDTTPSICVVYDHWTNAIQASISDLETIEALITLEDIAHIISLMRFPPERIPEIL